MARTLMMGYGLHMAKYYTDKVGVSAALFGTAHLVYAVVNSINDPIVGGIINQSKNRLNKSKYIRYLWLAVPIMLLGAFFSVFILSDWPTWLVFLFMFLGLSLADTGGAMHLIARNCLWLEETEGESGRGRQIGISQVFTITAGVVIYALPVKFVTDNSVSQENTVMVFAAFLVVGLLIYSVSMLLLKPKVPEISSQEQERTKVLLVLKRIVTNKKFLAFVLVAFFAGIAPSMMATTAIYYEDNVMELAPNTITMVAGLSLPLNFIVFAFAGRLIEKFGLKKLFYISSGIQLVVYLSFLYGVTGGVGIVAITLGGVLSQFWWVIWFVLIGNITDDYKKKYGEVDDAMFIGIQAILLSPAPSIGRFIFFKIIETFGYDGEALHQTSRAILGLRIGIGGVSALVIILAILFMMFYTRIEKREKAEEIASQASA
jgi:melibiose permease